MKKISAGLILLSMLSGCVAVPGDSYYSAPAYYGAPGPSVYYSGAYVARPVYYHGREFHRDRGYYGHAPHAVQHAQPHGDDHHHHQ